MILARAPNHLGDGVMALPALEALGRLGPLTLHAPEALHPLFAHLGTVRRPGRMAGDVAVLFTPSFRAAWEARRVSHVVGTPTDHRSWLLSRSVAPDPSRAETYRRLVMAVGVDVDGPPSWPVEGRAADVPEGHVALNPWAKGGANRRWRGFRRLADQLDRPVVFYAGPGEGTAVRALAGPHPVLEGLSLVDLAATLRRAAWLVSNDTGPAHLARAVGVRTLVVHTSTTAARTGPAGAIAVEAPELPCRPCYRNTCAHDLECLGISVRSVLEHLVA